MTSKFRAILSYSGICLYIWGGFVGYKLKKMKTTIYTLFLGIQILILSSCGGDNFKPELIPVLVGEKWGYIDLEGKYAINPQFDNADYFVDGIALVQSSGKYGYITKDGKYLINAQYKDASNFSEGLAAVVPENGKIKYIDKKGNVKFELSNAEYAGDFHNGLARVLMNDKWGFVDQTGKVIINAIYDRVDDFVGNLAGFKVINEKDKISEEQWGYLDKSGKIVINAQFKSVGYFSDGLARVSIDNEKYGFIDEKGKYVINPQFDWASNFFDGIAAIQQGDNWGVINKEGKIIINPQFEDINLPATNGLIAVKSNEKWGYIDMDGKYVINPQFEVALNFIGKVAIVKSADKIGLIDKDGKYIVNPQFDGGKTPANFSFYGEGYSFDLVQSDYFDVNTAIGKLLADNSFLGLKEKSTVKDVRTLFNLKPTDFSSKYVSIYNTDEINKKFGTKNTNITTVKVEFGSDAYSYKEKYDYYTNYWGQQTKYVSGREKVFVDTAKVSSINIKMNLYDKASGKGEKLANSIKEELIKKYKLEDVKKEEENLITLKSKDEKTFAGIGYSEDKIEIVIAFGKTSKAYIKSITETIDVDNVEYEEELYGDYDY